MLDRPATCDFEITPEMIEAGALELASFDRAFDTHEEGVSRIFNAMMAARIREACAKL